MNRISILLAAMLILALSGVALAQDEDEEAGDILEITLSGGLGMPMSGLSDWQTGADMPDPEVIDRAPKSGPDFGIDIGYFVTSKLIAGISFYYTEFGIDTDQDAGHNHRLFTPAIYGKYYFEGESDLVPYVSAKIGLENAKFSTWVSNPAGSRFREISYDPTLFFGAGLGLFYYTADYSGVFIEADYRMASTESTTGEYLGNDYTFGENIAVLQINLGVRLLIGSDD